MKNLKYLIFFVSWVIFFYLVFAAGDASFSLSNWDEMTRYHFQHYGFLLGMVFTLFYWMDDNWRVN